MKKSTLFKVFIAGMVLHIFVNVFASIMQKSSNTYEKYLSGEYYFRALAVTTAPQDPSLTLNTDLDYSDPKNLLLVNSGWEVAAYDPHGPYCTVEYGGDVIEDFPINRLRFLSQEDRDVFNGKVYTEEEFNARIKAISEDLDPSKKNALSTERMLSSGKNSSIGTLLLALMMTTVIPAGIMFILRDNEYLSGMIAIVWVVLCVVYDAILFHTLF